MPERRSVKVSCCCLSNCRAATLKMTKNIATNLTKMHMTQNQTVKLCQVGSSTPIVSNPPPPHLSLPCSSPRPAPPALSPPLREALFKQKNVVVFLAGCACRLLPTPGFSRRPVLFLALISGCWKFGNRCLKPCKRF